MLERASYDLSKRLNQVMSWNDGVCDGKSLLKTSGNAISETLNFKMSLGASSLKNLCLWCEFQSCLLFIISLLLKTFLTALLMYGQISAWKVSDYVWLVFDQGIASVSCTELLIQQHHGCHSLYSDIPVGKTKTKNI